MRMFTASLLTILIMVGFVWFNLLGGQQVNEDQLLKLLKGVIALQPNEVPGFETEGGSTNRVDLKARGYNLEGISLDLYQNLSRESIKGRGKDEIVILARLLPNRDTAYQMALWLAETQVAHPDAEPGRLPQGSWTGLPIGEKSWASAPKTGRVSLTASLVVWDDRLALRVRVSYPPLDPMARNLVFFPIEQQDLELGELAARLILAKANLVLLGWRELPTVRLVANGKNLEAKKTKEGAVFVPVQAILREMGGKAERKLGVILVSWKGKKVTMPIGARAMLVGKEKIALNLPILWDGKEAWVEGTGMAKGLGLALRWEKGKLVLAKR